jgi:hypothetical protein
MIPKDLMNVVNGGTNGPKPMAAGATGSPQASTGPTSNSPVSAPMSTPEPKKGDKQNAMINVSLAQDLLEQTLPAIGSETEEGRVILKVLSTLSEKFGESTRKSKDLVPSELMQLMHNLPQMGGMSPEMKALQGGGGGASPPKPPMTPAPTPQPPMQ